MSREEKDVHSHAGEHENLAIQKKLYFVSKEREREGGGGEKKKTNYTSDRKPHERKLHR